MFKKGFETLANVKNNAAAKETCRKLIEAAGEVFAEKGLHAATLQEITDRAGANKAAVNYHFRDKFELYAEVVRQGLTFGNIPPAPEDRRGTPEDQLRRFIARMVRQLLDPSQPPWRATIIAHEIAQPTAAMDAVMNDLFVPKSCLLREIVQANVGTGATEEKISRLALSIVSQCIFYLHSRSIITRLYPALNASNNSIDDITAHVTEFSLDALRAARRRLKTPSRQVKLTRRRA